MRVVQRVSSTAQKLNKLVLLALEILDVASQHRITQQLLYFLQHFRDFISLNDASHINLDTRTIDNNFKKIFQIAQFNISPKSLTLVMLLLDPRMKILLDPNAEDADYLAKLQRFKARVTAGDKKQFKSPRVTR